jgi:biopolymer transport protein ExbD
MKKFKTNINKRETKISTASLPDIVFLLLFFFMVSATMKENDDLVHTQLPEAQNITKAEMKILVKTLIVGVPKNKSFGDQPLITDGHKFIELSHIVHWANEMKSELPDFYRDQMIVLIKADESVNMGVIAVIQEKLKEANARKVIYRTTEESL